MIVLISGCYLKVLARVHFSLYGISETDRTIITSVFLAYKK